ncbi:MBL fold metallo-hydrolase [Actinoplanes xinjiangensis]|uniref:MBL fold metallo-hydrolase n=1 Tax=Actinoplanes xinjiangensis TaxID=512350 RepID=UPI0034453215
MTDIVEHEVGDVTVLALCDAVGTFDEPARALFPGATTRLWAESARIDPLAAGLDDPWRLTFRCFAVRDAGGGVLLVDAGIGPSSDWSPSPGRLPARLAEAGITPDDVTTVLLTHLHTDHIGWAAVDGEPYFRNARYVVQREEVTHYPWLRDTLLDPLRDRLHLLDGRTAVTPSVTAVPAPGHTPGHQAVLVSSGGTDLVLGGDVVQHAVHLLDPDVGYAYDADPEVARATRRALLAEVLQRGAALGTAHINVPFVTGWPVSTSGS